jgi:TetR/AcrR family transcriptional regulator
MIPTRERNPERSRERILDAALEEFAAKGFAGARVEAIAKAAGLNKQLISHHFGGKEGLYRAVLDRRFALPGGELNAPEGGLSAMFERAAADQQWARILLWEALEAGTLADHEGRRVRYARRVEQVREAQAAGRLPADLDPELLLLSLFGAAVYPVLVPQVAELVTGLQPTGRTFRKRYRDHLSRLATVLSGGRSA